MIVKKWMASKVITIEQDAPASLAFDLLITNNIRHLPVVSKTGKLVGIITDRDLNEALIPADPSPSQKNIYQTVKNIKAKKIMTPNPITLEENTPIDQAAKLFIERKIDCLPIKNSKGRLSGILTSTDILKAFIAFSEILGEIQCIDIVMGADEYDEVLELLHTQGVSVISVGITSHNDLDQTIFSFRIKDADYNKINNVLKEKGYLVLPDD